MGQPFHLRMKSRRTGETVELSGEFPNEDWSRLVFFRQQADKLEQTEMVQHGCGVRLSSVMIPEGATYEVSMPPRPYVAEFMHAMRPFVLKKDSSYFPSICNVLSRHFDHPVPRQLLTARRDHFLGRMFNSMLVISWNERALNTDEALREWAQAFEYHPDPDEMAKFAHADALVPLAPIYLSMLFDQAKAVLSVASMVEGLEKRGGVEQVHHLYLETATVGGTITFAVE
jgi:hypothetical protein